MLPRQPLRYLLADDPESGKTIMAGLLTKELSVHGDFQLFMALLDGDRFEGRFRDGVHAVDTSDLMRRLVNEQLLKFDGTPLFPERMAYTVKYDLSDPEAKLYEQVTEYVREEFNRAEARRLQPHFIASFFLEAFRLLGGTVWEREPKRYEITSVPAVIRNRDRAIGHGTPVMTRYERITFERRLIAVPGKALEYANQHLVPSHFEELRGRKEELVDKTMAAVKERLTEEINYWDHRADDLAARLQKRVGELEQERKLSPLPPVVFGAAHGRE